VVLANLCFVPLANKLKEFMDQDELRLELIQEGILDIYDQEHPKAIQYKLETLAGTLAVPQRSSPRPKIVLLSPYDQPRGARV